MSWSHTIKAQSQAEGAEELVNGGILVALGLSVFILDEWPGLTMSLIVAFVWFVLFLLLKGPELVRLVRRTD